MKNLYLFVSLLVSPFGLLAQNIHGIWSGTMVNDTLKVVQNFELGLGEYRGKITGYTYQTYIIEDTFYYSVKRVRAERKDGFLVVEDVERIADNFPDKAARKVRMTAKFPLINDTTINFLKGHWNTNQTKVYYSVGGNVHLQRLQDEKESDLLAHLQEINVKTDLAVRQKQDNKDEPVAKNSTKTKPLNNSERTSTSKTPDVVKNSRPSPMQNSSSSKPGNIQKGDASNTEVESKKSDATTNNRSANENNLTIQNAATKQEPANSNNQSHQNNLANSNKSATEIKSVSQIQVPEQKNATVQPMVEKKQQPVIKDKIQEQKVASSAAMNAGVAKTSNPSAPTDRTTEQKAVNAVATNKPVIQNKESIGTVKELPSIVAERRNQNIQDIYFKNDSLVLSLYDNGIVDGDTVSVFMNGENIISRQRLKEAATKKTIYISSHSDSVQLVLFAENLGSIPPNTGLLTVRDGDDVYQVRFSADLQTNASIILRRRKDQ
jgi:hypothetical protein